MVATFYSDLMGDDACAVTKGRLVVKGGMVESGTQGQEVKVFIIPAVQSRC